MRKNGHPLTEKNRQVINKLIVHGCSLVENFRTHMDTVEEVEYHMDTLFTYLTVMRHQLRKSVQEDGFASGEEV